MSEPLNARKEIARIAASIAAVVNAPESGIWIDYSGKAKARRGGIAAHRRKFAFALHRAGFRLAAPRDAVRALLEDEA